MSATDSQRPMLSWSGDSQCVAVSFVDEQKRTRRTCLWSDEGELISRLQPFPHIEEALTYRFVYLCTFNNTWKIASIGVEHFRTEAMRSFCSYRVYESLLIALLLEVWNPRSSFSRQQPLREFKIYHR